MDLLAWLWWLVVSVLGTVLSIAWFLVSGWVSTLLQIALLVLVIYSYKYGCRRAPLEIWKRTSGFARFFWNWLRAREAAPGEPQVEVREVVRLVRVKEPGDINFSTLLSVLVLAGLAGLAIG